MCRWDELPQNMQVEEVKKYYDILQRHKVSLIPKLSTLLLVPRALVNPR